MGKNRGSKWRRQARPLVFDGSRTDVGPDGHDYEVRTVSAARAVKTYRCPGCDHEIRPGIGHVVVWPAGMGEAAAEDRRHWHAPCWANRRTRGPTRRWS